MKLKVDYETALKTLTELDEQGNSLRVSIENTYNQLRKDHRFYQDEHCTKWEKEAGTWYKKTQKELSNIFESGIECGKFQRYQQQIPIYRNGENLKVGNLRIFLETKIEYLDKLIERLETNHNPQEKTFSEESKKVFIIHGRDEKAKNDLKQLLEEVGLEPIVLDKEPNKGRTIIEKIEKYLPEVGFVFVLLTPDDIGMLKSDIDKFLNKALTQAHEIVKIPVTNKYVENKAHIFETIRKKIKQALEDGENRARQNVIFELGLFMGKLGRSKVCYLYTGDIKLPSDLDGLLHIKYEKSVKEGKEKIIRELKNAGYTLKN